MKAATRWLRTLARIGQKQQRQAVRTAASLLAPPPPKRRRARSTGTASTTAAATKSPSRKKIEYVPPATGKWLASHVTALGEPGTLGPVRRMSYWLYVPDNASGPLPLIVMLHGCEQTATLFAQGTRMNQLAEKAGFAVVYPQQSLSAHSHRCWKWYDRATQHGGGDVPLIMDVVRKVQARYPIDAARIYIGGISAGAAMAHIVALNHPGLFAAVGLHSGPLFGAGHNALGALAVMQHGADHRLAGAVEEVLARQPVLPALPTLLIQGTHDTVVRPVNQEQLARQVRLLNGLPDDARTAVTRKSARGLAYEVRDVYQGRKLMLRVASIERLAHAWSGGDGRLQYNSAEGPDASRMMLQFFKQHRRTG